MVVSGTKTITASVDPLRFAIKCSTGPTIPVESDGTPKSSSVNIEFYQFEADGSLSPYIADAGIIAFLNASGSAVSRKSIDSVSSYNITGDLADKSIVSVRVVLYEDVTAQAILASETFSLSYPTEVELPITVSLNNGASAIYCDANGKPKYYNILIVNAIILAFKRGDSPVKVSLKSIAYIDGVEGEPYSYDTSDDGTFSDFLAANLLANNYITKIRYDFYPYGGSEDEMQSVEFPVVYDSPVPRPVGKSWSADMTFKNGEYIMLTTTSGGTSSTMIYMWKYPIEGNTDVDPATYIKNDTKPAKWDRWEKNDLLATSVLLADFALIGKAVFQGDYMMSQQGVDAEGNESSDYTKFPDGFTPNFLVNFITGLVGIYKGNINLGGGKTVLKDDGSGHLAGGNFSWLTTGHRLSKAPEIVQWINISSYSDTVSQDGINMNRVDYAQGCYLFTGIDAFGMDKYKLDKPEIEGFKIVLKLNIFNRHTSSAILYYPGGFRGYQVESGDFIHTSGDCMKLNPSAGNSGEVSIVYNSTLDRFDIENAEAADADYNPEIPVDLFKLTDRYN